MNQREALADNVWALMKTVSDGVPNVCTNADFGEKSRMLKDFIRETRKEQLSRLGGDDTAPMRMLVKLDILNAYERMRGYYENIAETICGGKAPKE